MAATESSAASAQKRVQMCHRVCIHLLLPVECHSRMAGEQRQSGESSCWESSCWERARERESLQEPAGARSGGSFKAWGSWYQIHL